MSQLSFVVFSEHSEFERLLESSGHVEVTARLASLSALVETVKHRRPNGLLVELGDEPEAVLAEVEKIPAPRPALIVSGPNQSDLILRAMRLGAREYVASATDQETELKAAIERLLLETRKSEGEARDEAPILTVMGSKGGVGSTFVACQLAAALAARGSSVAIVDLNLRLGDVALFFDLQPRYTVANLAADREAIDAAYMQTILAPTESGVSVVAAPQRLEEADLVDGDHVGRALGILRRDFDWVVVDASRSYDEATVRALDLADQILLVTLPDVPTLSHTRQHLDLLERLGHPAEKIRLVGNRVDRNAPVSGREAAKFLGRKLDMRLPNDYASTVACVNEGRPLARVAPKSKLCAAFQDLGLHAYEWCDLPAPAAPQGGALKKLFRRN